LYHSTLGLSVIKKKEGFRVQGFRFQVSGFRFQVSGFRVQFPGSGFGDEGV